MQNAAAASNPTANNLAVLMDMGFSEEQAKEALKRVENLEDAIAILLNDQVQLSAPSSPGVSQPDSADDDVNYATYPRSMIFIINTGHPTLSFPSCLLSIAQVSLDLYDQIMVNRSHLLSFKTWHSNGEVKQLFECSNGHQLRDLSRKLDFTVADNQICMALITDPQQQEPVCLALFGISSDLEQYISQFKRLQMCPSRFFISNDDSSNTDSSMKQ